mgnify:CR=1 FL=1
MNKLTKYACILTALAGAVACSDGKKAQGDYAVIPLPQEITQGGNTPFLLKPSTPISYQEGDTEMEQTARFLASYIKEATGYEPKVIAGNADRGIHLSIASDIQHPEGYRLPGQRERHRDRRSIQRRHFLWRTDLAQVYPRRSRRNGCRTSFHLHQRLSAFPLSRYAPRCFPPFLPDRLGQEVHRYARLAQHEPFPLAPDRRPGWRIEIKKYPELTKIGAQRKETVIGRNSGKYDGKPYGEGMFYTQDEIRDVIA